jgi:hypothetical protein
MGAICGGRPPPSCYDEGTVAELTRLSDVIISVGPTGQINSPPFLDIL